VENPVMHASRASQYLSPTGTLFFEKNFLENMQAIPKKSGHFLYASERQNRQGFLRLHRLKPFTVAGFIKRTARKA
jgi:hypothetical protein